MKINNKIIFSITMILLVVAVGIKICKESNINKKEMTENKSKYSSVENDKESINLVENKIAEENTNQAENEKVEENVIIVTKENFEEVIKSDKIVIVDFWADWCTPCLYIAPILEEIAKENDDIILCKVNVDEEEKLSADYNITMIPTMIIFKNGKKENELVGLMSKEQILKYIEELR